MDIDAAIHFKMPYQLQIMMNNMSTLKVLESRYDLIYDDCSFCASGRWVRTMVSEKTARKGTRQFYRG